MTMGNKRVTGEQMAALSRAINALYCTSALHLIAFCRSAPKSPILNDRSYSKLPIFVLLNVRYLDL